MHAHPTTLGMHVRLWLLELDVKHETLLIDEDDKPAWFTKLSKIATLPLLRDKERDLAITDSVEIISFVRQRFREPDLSAPLEQGKITSIDIIHEALDVMRARGNVVDREARREIVIGHFQLIDIELATLGTDFFGGSRPNAVDLDLVCKLYHVVIILDNWDAPVFEMPEVMPTLQAYMLRWEERPYWSSAKDPVEAVIAHWRKYFERQGIDHSTVQEMASPMHAQAISPALGRLKAAVTRVLTNEENMVSPLLSGNLGIVSAGETLPPKNGRDRRHTSQVSSSWLEVANSMAEANRKSHRHVGAKEVSERKRGKRDLEMWLSSKNWYYLLLGTSQIVRARRSVVTGVRACRCRVAMRCDVMRCSISALLWSALLSSPLLSSPFLSSPLLSSPLLSSPLLSSPLLCFVLLGSYRCRDHWLRSPLLRSVLLQGMPCDTMRWDGRYPPPTYIPFPLLSTNDISLISLFSSSFTSPEPHRNRRPNAPHLFYSDLPRRYTRRLPPSPTYGHRPHVWQR